MNREGSRASKEMVVISKQKDERLISQQQQQQPQPTVIRSCGGGSSVGDSDEGSHIKHNSILEPSSQTTPSKPSKR